MIKRIIIDKEEMRLIYNDKLVRLIPYRDYDLPIPETKLEVETYIPIYAEGYETPIKVELKVEKTEKYTIDKKVFHADIDDETGEILFFIDDKEHFDK